MAFALSTAIAQPGKDAEPTGLQAVGQQAINIVLKRNVLDPTALVPKTGKPLPVNGRWSVGRQTPAACPQASDACVLVLYQVPEDGVSCEWVVRLAGDGSDGIILQQNEDSTHYLLRRIGTDQAGDLVVTKKKPVYPPIAAAAHVAGTVKVRVFVSQEGAIEKAVLVSGPEMLRASALDAVKGWGLKPLMTGTQATRFETNIEFDYAMSGPYGSVKSKP